ncbi:MAG: sulfur carrier protein ThiS [Sulfobacillus sp.]
MVIEVNGASREVPAGVNLTQLLAAEGLTSEWLAVAVDGTVIAKSTWDTIQLQAGQRVEIVTAMAGGADQLELAGEHFSSRLFCGTGKYRTMALMRQALAASGSQLVTVAVRLLQEQSGPPILPELDASRFRILPNTAGAHSAEQAVHIARLGRELIGHCWVKLEVIGDQQTLWPDVTETIAATKTLVAEGFVVLAYTSPDLVAALRLEDAGAAAVMPLAAPIGSGQGLQDWSGISRLRQRISATLVVDAGIGVPSDACLAMEMGADAVLVNTAIARANDPVGMANAMRLGVEAGRAAFLAGRMPKLAVAEPSSPAQGVPRPS